MGKPSTRTKPPRGPLTRAYLEYNLAQAMKHDPNAAAIEFHSNCHDGSGMRLIYEGGDYLVAVCAECDCEVQRIKVAKND